MNKKLLQSSLLFLLGISALNAGNFNSLEEKPYYDMNGYSSIQKEATISKGIDALRYILHIYTIKNIEDLKISKINKLEDFKVLKFKNIFLKLNSFLTLSV
jgi:hypothetical protein